MRFSIISRRRNKKFFDPTIFQKCWRGSGRAALIAARRQRPGGEIPPCHPFGTRASGEKSDSFFRGGGQNKTAPPCETLVLVNKYVAMFRWNSYPAKILPYRKSLLIGKTIFTSGKGVPPAFCLPAYAANCPVALSEFALISYKS